MRMVDSSSSLRAGDGQDRNDGLRLLEGRVVRSAVDDVQRPPIGGAGSLGHPQGSLAVETPPDEGGRYGDPFELNRRDSGPPK